jgi:Kef-type K+ transport system membrane component KefB
MWWVALVVTLGLMALFQWLTRSGPLEARATLALGFLILAAHLSGEVAKRVRLPRITAYLMTGIIVGPAWLGLVRGDEVSSLAFIADAALALIAFTAGSKLTLDVLRRDRQMLARLSLWTIVLPLGFVALVTLSVSPWFPLTVHQPFGDAVAVALVLGTIAAASSPVLTVALTDELNARGAFSRTVLGVTVAKDVLVVVLFALVLVLARPLASGGALDLRVARTTLLGALASIAVGAVLGFMVSRYLRLLSRDTPLVLIALAFLTGQVGLRLGLETMLIALTAGFCVANFSPAEGKRLDDQFQRGALLVYVAFFAVAGAGLPLDAATLRELWPWVFLLGALRASGLRLGTRFAGRSPGVPAEVASHGWLGLIGQGGVVFGLAAAARRAFPEWGVSLEALVVVMIGVHAIAGPITFRQALRLTGEVTEGEHVTEKSDSDRPALVPGSGSL